MNIHDKIKISIKIEMIMQKILENILLKSVK